MKKNTTKKRPNLMQFTLSLESQKILDDFTAKYGTSKSMIIDRALLLLAGQYHRKILISYELLTEEESTTTTTTKKQNIDIVDYRKKHPINKDGHFIEYQGKKYPLTNEQYETLKNMPEYRRDSYIEANFLNDEM